MTVVGEWGSEVPETVNKQDLSERDICTKFITPAIKEAGWNVETQVREEVTFTKGRVIVRGRLVNKGKSKRADYILYYKPNFPIAIIEAKDNHHTVGDGIQQAISYGETLDIPFVYSSNGDGFLEHDFTVRKGRLERDLNLNSFPSPENLWQRFKDIEPLLFPVPPLKEQIRLVDKVDGLLGLCDDLEAKLKQSRSDSDRLMEAVVREMVAA